jgi:hypothetical protein
MAAMTDMAVVVIGAPYKRRAGGSILLSGDVVGPDGDSVEVVTGASPPDLSPSR